MKQTVYKSEFCDQFRVMDRVENFSYEARELLFDYFEELEQGCGEELEFDVIAICCEYSEDSVEDIAANYSIDLDDCDGDEDCITDAVRDYLNENTALVGETSVGFVYARF